MEAITTLIGRKKEQQTLLNLLQTTEPEMVAVIGRRRVGKTFLIRSVYEKRIDFELTGIQNATQPKQLQNFYVHLKIKFGASVVPKKKPTNWLDAFYMLITLLEMQNKQEKAIVFLDELSWLATPKSGFLEALGFFWNSWASSKNIVVVICASAASWMIEKVVYHKGGLHNRITKRIDLQPFTLYETELFLKTKGITERYQILQLYMAMGGIPHYLKEVERGKSAIQNIDTICFSQGGLLNDEFSKLYPALFEHSEQHIAIIRTLSQKWKGMSRAEIIITTKLPDGGGISQVIEELVSCGFVSAYFPFGKKKKEMLYRLTDEYSLFYLHFIENQKIQDINIWQNLSQTQSWKSWSGYAFESLCLKHLPQIKKALGISGIYTEASAYVHKGNAAEQGIQIDLVLDRKDQVINIFEMKFYNAEWSISKSEAHELRERVALFKRLTKTQKQVFLSVISTFGIKMNDNSLGLIDNDLRLEVLFES